MGSFRVGGDVAAQPRLSLAAKLRILFEKDKSVSFGLSQPSIEQM
jgi:hypothetical protein